jgi:predicted amidophosphoribosyltransferase
VDYVAADKFKQTIVGSCAFCGADLKGGKPVKQGKFCKECGKPVEGAKFCPECGAAH